jgi:glycosyltransferase involved in cell wall biosynthesis
MMRIVIDTKNLALYSGGIAHWFSPLLAAWIAHRPDAYFLLVGPCFDSDFLSPSNNWEHVSLSWPEWLPRSLRHPWYDNVMFPRAVSRLRPDLVMSPYHDVRMPKGVPSVISVHDLCLDELSEVYPRRIRVYYLALLRQNLRRAALVITVSETSRNKLIERYGIARNEVSVVYNTLPAAFEGAVEAAEVAVFRKRYCSKGSLLFYPGGSEYRKNITRLILTFSRLAQRDESLILLVTGGKDIRWETALAEIPHEFRQRVIFAGRLNDTELHLAYIAADAVVYPSLCEGFGRVCLEAMDTGTPLACSDLPVMREVAGDYAHYFDPFEIESIADAVAAALSQGHCSPVRDARFREAAVRASFLSAMDRLIGGNQ